MADVPVVLRTKEDDPATDLQAGGRETLQREGSIAKVNLRKNLNEGRHSSNPRTPWTRRKSREQLLDIEIDVDGTENLPRTPWDEPGDEKPVKEGADGIKIDENLDPAFREKLQKFVRQYNEIFRTGVGSEPARVTPFKFKVDDKNGGCTIMQNECENHVRRQG